ncbi:MAG: hypothetical protein U9P79_03575 [Candidatus Cloacimonadota bacterium]|nr:hypothetical protein [Candidatus Cloacimonadota bacterium]
MKRYLLILLFVIISSPVIAKNVTDSLLAPQRFSKYILANSEIGYITFFDGIGNLDPLWFEAKLVPNYLIKTKNSRMGAVLTPKIILRMFKEKSDPVLTPSYMPQVTVYSQLNEVSETSPKVTYLFVRFSHHSNGQDGDFFNENGSINTYDGSFSTNFIELGFFVSKLFSYQVNANDFFRTSLEFHPKYLQDEVLNDLYGNIRWHNDFRIFKFSKEAFTFLFSRNETGDNHLNKNKIRPRFRANINTTIIFGEMKHADTFDFSKRFSGSITLSYNPEFLEDIRFFIQYYFGSDYYNIHFENTLSEFRIGLMADPFGV